MGRLLIPRAWLPAARWALLSKVRMGTYARK